MNKNLKKLIEPSFTLYFVVFFCFSIAATVVNLPLGISALSLCMLLMGYHFLRSRRRRREVVEYMKTIAVEVNHVSRSSITHFPMPALVALATTGEILWTNDAFGQVTGLTDCALNKRINELAPTFDTRWLIDGKRQYPTELRLGKNSFQVYGNLLTGEGEVGALIVLYFVECTQYVRLRDEYALTRPVVSIIAIDNYEELTKGLSDSEKSEIVAGIDKRISDWSRDSHAMLRKFDRDKYVFVLEVGALQKLANEKFSVLADVREISNHEGVIATLSIGVGKDGDSFEENLRFANLAIDMSLSRGGDQAVIKNKYAFEFYGGLSKEVEKRTKVKSRVVANALSQLIRDSSQVFIMGHTMADMDAVGAAVGLACAVRERERPVHIVLNRERNLATELVARVEKNEAYRDTFIGVEDAIVMADFNSLLIVVDTNRPDYVESPALLDSMSKVAVIDHHRRAADYIEKSVLNLHEPYASSTAELVSELLQYMVTTQNISPIEAEALMAGIYLDTKGFSLKAGVRTFEAAAYLKRAGAEVTNVKTLFQSSFQKYMDRQTIIAGAKDCGYGIILAVTKVETDRAIAAQAADELLGIVGVRASIVAFQSGEDTIVSARSTGKVNVQILMEKLGGGGNLSAAGAQIRGATIQEAEARIQNAIEKYVAENNQQKAERAEAIEAEKADKGD